jgi:hypothetical protein
MMQSPQLRLDHRSRSIDNWNILSATKPVSRMRYLFLTLQYTLLTFQVVQDSFIPPPKLTDEAVVALLQDLESVIRLRLQLQEHIPVQLLRRPYRIRKLIYLWLFEHALFDHALEPRLIISAYR